MSGGSERGGIAADWLSVHYTIEYTSRICISLFTLLCFLMLTHIERKYIYLTMQLEELLHLSTLQRMKIKSSELWGRGGPIQMFFRSVLSMMGGLCPLTSHCELMMTVMMMLMVVTGDIHNILS